ncbi:hypothetical protein RJT34_32988 [Clitoria ternatea]|uniref:Uncharacterized protein n=1 Tax=Clitoria ternatea TaxID=43366 RepID=A0AAN9EYG9_CLITE
MFTPFHHSRILVLYDRFVLKGIVYTRQEILVVDLKLNYLIDILDQDAMTNIGDDNVHCLGIDDSGQEGDYDEVDGKKEDEDEWG